MTSLDERTSQIEQANQAPFLLLHEGDIRRALLDFEGRAFHYTTNVRGQRVLLLFSGIALAGAAGIYFYTQFASLLWFLLASGLAIFAVVMTASVYRWHKFAQTSFVAINDTFLYFGNDKRAWRIAWDLLDAKALGFEDYESERLSGTLSLDVAGQKIDLHLYQPLAYIEDLHGVMFELLSHMQGGSEALAMALESEEE